MESELPPRDPNFSPTDVARLLQQVAVKGKSLLGGNNILATREELLADARSLCNALETPMEAILRQGWANPALEASVRVGLDLKLFEALEKDRDSPKSSTQLAELTGSDPVLLSRILKHLSTMEFIVEVSSDKYRNSRLSSSLVDPLYRGGFAFCLNTLGTAFRALPAQLSKTGYKNPTDPLDAAFQLGHQTSSHAFEFFQKNDFAGFNNHMAGYNLGRARWFDYGCFPVDKVLVDGFEDSEGGVLLVDIGGATGHDLVAFHQQNSHLAGRLILQDLPITIEQVKDLPQAIEAMPHDFFTEQPVKGARAYYIHNCLHDWPDNKAEEILRNLVPAMKKGYSKLLINENVVPDEDAHWQITGLDMLMMSVFAATERARSNWERILNAAGLRLVKVWMTIESNLALDRYLESSGNDDFFRLTVRVKTLVIALSSFEVRRYITDKSLLRHSFGSIVSAMFYVERVIPYNLFTASQTGNPGSFSNAGPASNRTFPVATKMDQYWHKTGICGIISRATLRTLQLVFAVTIMGIYGPDLARSTATNTSAHPEWIFAQVAACLSASTCITHCFVTVTRVAWCLWDWVLCVLWMSQAGVFGSIYLKTGKMEQYEGATTSEKRMRAGVGIGLVNMVLWLGNGILGFAWCCQARKFTRRGKASRTDISDERVDGRDVMESNDFEKDADEKFDGEESFLPGARVEGKESLRKENGSFKTEEMGTFSRPPSYESV
ncbi:hypothetical protein VTL71DRAFT_1119 [Oculimacula yallundae]|uniref:O-methyltransferase domain-containing protein n=1 Tax=Oculimacula yallundae TaxID=86028 RepID=A0ABR4D330_9HELO